MFVHTIVQHLAATCLLQAESELLAQDLDKEYAGILGYESFRDSAVALAFGESCDQVKNKLVSPCADMCFTES